jgi:hypothetical protein
MKGMFMTQQAYNREREVTRWTGWVVSAVVMMILGGLLGAMFGLVAIVNDDWVVFENSDAVSIDLTGWGWIHLIVGVVLVLAGFGVFSGNVIARAVGVLVAAVSLIANFLWLPVYPIWSLVVIAIDVLVIWALTAHGGEMRGY